MWYLGCVSLFIGDFSRDFGWFPTSLLVWEAAHLPIRLLIDKEKHGA
jgi:hypothetical protein